MTITHAAPPPPSGPVPWPKAFSHELLVDMLRSQGVVPLALVAPTAGAPRAVLADIPLWHDEAKILAYRPDEVHHGKA